MAALTHFTNLRWNTTALHSAVYQPATLSSTLRHLSNLLILNDIFAKAILPKEVWRVSFLGRKDAAMKMHFTPAFHDALNAALDDEITTNGMVNIPRLAEEIRMRNEALNIALEDVTYELMRRALARNALMEFGPEEYVTAH